MWKCSQCEAILAVIILVWTIWPNLLGLASTWVVGIAAALLLIHALWCKKCRLCEGCGVDMAKPAAKRKRRR